MEYCFGRGFEQKLRWLAIVEEGSQLLEIGHLDSDLEKRISLLRKIEVALPMDFMTRPRVFKFSVKQPNLIHLEPNITLLASSIFAKLGYSKNSWIEFTLESFNPEDCNLINSCCFDRN